MVDQAPLIVSLRMDPASFQVLDTMRRRNFPPERNHLRAHLTLFHKLPGEEEATVIRDLEDVCAAQQPLTAIAQTLRFLGRGVAIDVPSPDLEHLRTNLASRWKGWLTPQDMQGFRPHVTVQNKVDPAQARALHSHLVQDFQPTPVTGEGLDLHRYRGGPWEAVRFFPFRA